MKNLPPYKVGELLADHRRRAQSQAEHLRHIANEAEKTVEALGKAFDSFFEENVPLGCTVRIKNHVIIGRASGNPVHLRVGDEHVVTDPPHSDNGFQVAFMIGGQTTVQTSVSNIEVVDNG